MRFTCLILAALFVIASITGAYAQQNSTFADIIDFDVPEFTANPPQVEWACDNPDCECDPCGCYPDCECTQASSSCDNSACKCLPCTCNPCTCEEKSDGNSSLCDACNSNPCTCEANTSDTSEASQDVSDDSAGNIIYDPFGSVDARLRALERNIRLLERTVQLHDMKLRDMLTRQDVTKIIQQELPKILVEIREKDATVTKTVQPPTSVRPDIGDTEVTVPGFSGSFRVPRGGKVVSITVGGQRYPVNNNGRVTSTTYHSASAGPYELVVNGSACDSGACSGVRDNRNSYNIGVYRSPSTYTYGRSGVIRRSSQQGWRGNLYNNIRRNNSFCIGGS